MVTVHLGITGLYYAFAFIGYQSFRKDYSKEILNQYLKEVAPEVFTLWNILLIFFLFLIFILKDSSNILTTNLMLYISLLGCFWLCLQLYFSYKSFYSENFLNTYISLLLERYYQDFKEKEDEGIPYTQFLSFQDFQKMILHAKTNDNRVFPEILFENYVMFLKMQSLKCSHFKIQYLKHIEEEISSFCRAMLNDTTFSSILRKYFELVNFFFQKKKLAFDDNVLTIVDDFFNFVLTITQDVDRDTLKHYKDVITPYVAKSIELMLKDPDPFFFSKKFRLVENVKRFNTRGTINIKILYSYILSNAPLLNQFKDNDEALLLFDELFEILETLEPPFKHIDPFLFSNILNEESVKSGVFEKVYLHFIAYSVRAIKSNLYSKEGIDEIEELKKVILSTTKVAINHELFTPDHYKLKIYDCLKHIERQHSQTMKEFVVDFNEIYNLTKNVCFKSLKHEYS